MKYFLPFFLLLSFNSYGGSKDSLSDSTKTMDSQLTRYQKRIKQSLIKSTAGKMVEKTGQRVYYIFGNKNLSEKSQDFKEKFTQKQWSEWYKALKKYGRIRYRKDIIVCLYDHNELIVCYGTHKGVVWPEKREPKAVVLTIKKNLKNGKMLLLSDGSIWEIYFTDEVKVSMWGENNKIVIIKSEKPMLDHKFMLVNKNKGETCHAKCISD